MHCGRLKPARACCGGYWHRVAGCASSWPELVQPGCRWLLCMLWGRLRRLGGVQWHAAQCAASSCPNVVYAKTVVGSRLLMPVIMSHIDRRWQSAVDASHSVAYSFVFEHGSEPVTGPTGAVCCVSLAAVGSAATDATWTAAAPRMMPCMACQQLRPRAACCTHVVTPDIAYHTLQA